MVQGAGSLAIVNAHMLTMEPGQPVAEAALVERVGALASCRVSSVCRIVFALCSVGAGAAR